MKQTGPLEEKIRAFFLPIVLGLAAVCILLLAAIPQFDQMKIDNQVLSDRQKAANILQAKLSTLGSLDESSQAETLDTALSALPLEEPYLEALLNLDTLLLRHQIGVSQIKVESAADNLSIKFMSTGPLSGIRNFIADADKILPLSATASIEAARIENDVYQAEISFQIFFKTAPKTIGRASDPLPPITADHLKTLKLLSQFEKIRPASAGDFGSDLIAAPRLFPE